MKVCYQGTAKDVQSLKSGTEDATGTRITLDDSNCVESFEATGAEGFEEIQQRFGAQVASRTVFTVQYDSGQFFSSYDSRTATANIHPGDVGGGYRVPGRFMGCYPFGRAGGTFTLGALIAHELIGHGSGQLTGRAHGQAESIRVENLYHAARGEPPRCQNDH